MGGTLNTSQLERTSEDYQRQVAQAVSQDSDLTSYVQRLEERYDVQADGDPRDLPTGDDLADELERFLREKGDEEQ